MELPAKRVVAHPAAPELARLDQTRPEEAWNMRGLFGVLYSGWRKDR
jgi:hypothetical protein